MALQDKIGRAALVDKICSLVDSLKKDNNFCLAINGAWGSGKSFVLGLKGCPRKKNIFLSNMMLGKTRFIPIRFLLFCPA